MPKSHRSESTGTSTATGTLGVGNAPATTDFGSNADNTGGAASTAPETGTLDLVEGAGFLFDEPSTGARYRARSDGCYDCVTPPPDAPHQAGRHIEPTDPDYEVIHQAHLDVLEGVELKKAELTGLVAKGPGKKDVAPEIWFVLVNEKSALCADLVLFLDVQGVMDDVLEGCSPDLLWSEDNVGETFRILSYRGDAANLAHAFSLTHDKRGNAKRKVGDADAILANELIDVVSIEGKQNLKKDEEGAEGLKDTKKTISRSTRKVDEDLIGQETLGTRYVGAVVDDKGVSNRDKLLQSLEKPDLWAPGSSAQLENTLRMVLAAGHRTHALAVCQRMAGEPHHAVLQEVGLMDAGGAWLEKPVAGESDTDGAFIEALDFLGETSDDGHIKLKPLAKTVDLKGVELDELQDVTGGSVKGITFAQTDGEDDEINQMDILADLEEGRIVVDSKRIEITSIDTPVLKSGAMAIDGLHIDLTMPTKKNPGVPVNANIAYDAISAKDVVLQLPEQMITIGSLDVGPTSIVSHLMKELPPGEQDDLVAALGADDAPKRVELTETFYPSLKKMFAAIGDLFQNGGAVVQSEMSIGGIMARDITTSGGVHQESAEMGAMQTHVDATSQGKDAKTLALDLELGTVSGPLDVDSPKVRILGPDLKLTDLGVDVKLELHRDPWGRMVPKMVHLNTLDVGTLDGGNTTVTMPNGLVARFPQLQLTQLHAEGIHWPGHGEELSMENALGDAKASLGTLEIASQVKDELTGALDVGGVLSMSGLSVASLNSQGVAFSLDDLHVEQGTGGVKLPGPLAALKNLGVELDYAGVQGLSGQVIATDDGFVANVDLASAGVDGGGSTDDGSAAVNASLTNTHLDVEVKGKDAAVGLSLGAIDTQARLDSPGLAIDGQLGLTGIKAEVSIQDGAATIEAFHLEHIDASNTTALLKQKGLEIGFPTVKIDDVHAHGIALPGKGEKLDVGAVLANGEAGIGSAQITGGVKDVLHNSLSAGGTFTLSDLQVGGLESGGIGFSLEELALQDAKASSTDPNSLLSKLGKKGASVKWAGVQGLTGSVDVGPDGVKGNVDVDKAGVEGLKLDGKNNSAVLKNTEVDFDLGKDEQAFGIELGKLATTADFDAANLGIKGKLDVVGVGAHVVYDTKAKALYIRSVHIDAIDASGTRVNVKPKGLLLDFPKVRITDVGAVGVQLPGKGQKLDPADLIGVGGSAHIGSADIRGGVKSTLKQSFTAGGRFVLDDLSVKGLESGGIAFGLEELAVTDLNVQASKLKKLGDVGVKVQRVGVDDVTGTLGPNSLDVNVGKVALDDATVKTNGATLNADANASGSVHVDDKSIVVDGTADAHVGVQTGGTLPGLTSSQVGGSAAKPKRDPKFKWSLPVLDTLKGRIGVVLPFGSERLALTGLVDQGKLDTGAMCENLAVDAIDYVKDRLPDVPEWLQFDILKKAGDAIEKAVKEQARSVGDSIGDQIPALRPTLEGMLNSPKGPKGASEPLDLSKYIGGLEGFDLQSQVKGALDVVANDAVQWLGAASSTVDFAKEDLRTSAWNNSKAIWYEWVAPAAQYVVPDGWEDNLKVSDKKIDAYQDWNAVKDEDRAKFLSDAMFDLIEGAADWAGDIGMDIDLGGQGPMFADEIASSTRAIDMTAGLTMKGAGTVQQGADLALGLTSTGKASFGNLDANGWFTVGTGVGGEVDDWKGTGHGDLDVAAGGQVTITR